MLAPPNQRPPVLLRADQISVLPAVLVTRVDVPDWLIQVNGSSSPVSVSSIRKCPQPPMLELPAPGMAWAIQKVPSGVTPVLPIMLAHTSWARPRPMLLPLLTTLLSHAAAEPLGVPRTVYAVAGKALPPVPLPGAMAPVALLIARVVNRWADSLTTSVRCEKIQPLKTSVVLARTTSPTKVTMVPEGVTVAWLTAPVMRALLLKVPSRGMTTMKLPEVLITVPSTSPSANVVACVIFSPRRNVPAGVPMGNLRVVTVSNKIQAAAASKAG